jgi:hypothetical protein
MSRCQRGHTVCFLILVLVVLAVLPVLVSAGQVDGGGAVIWTDKQDYSPEQTVSIYGSGFKARAYVTVSVTRPDGHVDEWGVLSDGYGAFIASYQLDGITGTYYVTGTDGTSTATATFTDQAAVSFTLEGLTLSPHIKMTTGAVKGWLEDEWVPFRLTITNKGDTDKSTPVTIQLDYRQGTSSSNYRYGIDAFANCFSSTAPDCGSGSTPDKGPSAVGTGALWKVRVVVGAVESERTLTSANVTFVDVGGNVRAMQWVLSSVSVPANANVTITWAIHLARGSSYSLACQSGSPYSCSSFSIGSGKGASSWTGASMQVRNVEDQRTVSILDVGGVCVGRIVIIKHTVGGDGTFNFTTNDHGLNNTFSITTDTNTGDATFNNLEPRYSPSSKYYSVTESGPSLPWDFTSLSCEDPSHDTSVSGATATIRLSAGETVTCTFTDTKRGHIIVDKVTDPSGDPTSFTFTPSYGAAFSLKDADPPKDSGPLLPGTYSVSETVPPDWDLTSATCDDGSPVNSIDLGAGETVKCTFTDTLKRGTIIVEKQTVGGDSTKFSFTGEPAGQISNGEQLKVENLVPGTYTSTETVPYGWKLTDITCDDTTSATPSSGDKDTGVATFNLDAGEVVKCTFTNEKSAGAFASIIVEKQTIPDGDPATFTFSGDAAGSISDNQQIVVVDLIPGTYYSTETVPPGWKLTSISCDDGNSVGDLDAKKATFNLEAGETVKCTFTNMDPSKLGTIVVEKQTIPDGDSATFTFTDDAAGTIGDNGQIKVENLVPGAYTSTETVPPGWKLTSISCDDGNSVGDLDAKKATFNLEAGETVKCTFTDTKLGTIVVEKQTIPPNDPQLFTFTGTAADTIGDGGQIVIVDLVPGSYTSTETVPDEWKLTDITCNDANSSGDLGTKTATFNLDAGETVKCTFTDEKPSRPPPPPAVGGELYSVDKSALVRPYVLGLLALLGAVAAAAAITRRRRP